MHWHKNEGCQRIRDQQFPSEQISRLETGKNKVEAKFDVSKFSGYSLDIEQNWEENTISYLSTNDPCEFVRIYSIYVCKGQTKFEIVLRLVILCF